MSRSTIEHMGIEDGTLKSFVYSSFRKLEAVR